MILERKDARFEWNLHKEAINIAKHGVTFEEAALAFEDECRVLAEDVQHSFGESRYYCMGKVNGYVMTVRFTMRDARIRIIGAGYWRKGRTIYEKAKKDRLH